MKDDINLPVTTLTLTPINEPNYHQQSWMEQSNDRMTVSKSKWSQFWKWAHNQLDQKMSERTMAVRVMYVQNISLTQI